MSSPSNSLVVRRDHCPVCSSTDLASIYQRSYGDPRMRDYMGMAYQGNVEYEYVNGAEFEIAECRACGMLFQPNVLNELGAKRLYDVWIDADLAKQWYQQERPQEAYYLGILRFARHYLQRPDVRMLDYGAGFGDFCRLGRQVGFDVCALEFSAERAAMLKKQDIQPILSGDEGTEQYHFISLNQVLEHLTDPLETLRRVRCALRDDGLVYVAVPNCRGLKHRLKSADSLSIPQFQQALLNCSAFQHINSFTTGSLKRVCEGAGFTLVFRPFQFIACSKNGTSPMGLAKSVVMPFYYRFFGTAFFLRKNLQR